MEKGITTATDRTTALLCGVRGLELTDEERAFIKRFQPWGFIIFARNVDNPDQLLALTDEMRSLSDHDAVPILVDQEGGRVQRLKPPHWPAYPTGKALGDVYRRDKSAGCRAAYLMSRLHAFDLHAVGVNVDCLPVLDVPTPDGHDVIGDRAYGYDVETVTDLGQAACEGLMAGGVQPVIKHIPGHGRATADSHHALPVVSADLETLRRSDFKPFTTLQHIPMAMTAHVIYSAIDPKLPATTSKKVMDEIVRGEMGYDGLVMCDDITMGALSGGLSDRARAISAAGCDIILHCTGHMDEMVEVAENTPILKNDALRRAERAVVGLSSFDDADVAETRREFAELMGEGPLVAAADPTDYGRTA